MKTMIFYDIVKQKLPVIILISFLAAIFSCNEEAVYTPDERFVLQAYLYAGEPVWDVTVRNAVPLTVSDSVGEPVNDAEITIYKNDIAYQLVSSSDSGTYEYPDDDLIIETGDDISISAIVGDREVSAQTTVPEAPTGVIISSDSILLPEIEFDDSSGFPDFTAIQELLQAQQDVQLEIVWDNPNGELFFIIVENAEESQESIFPESNGFFGRLNGRGAFRQISRPTRESSYQINFQNIQYWGKYIVKVYRVNQEYADLYENLEQDSRDLNEPPTNIKNGLGIFSAFNSQSAYFEVIKK